MAEDKFRTGIIAMSPDADPMKHRSVVETQLLQLTSVVVKNESEAVVVCKNLVQKDSVRHLMLCSGFTNQGVARISKAVGNGVSVNITRGDGPSNAL
jgi:hypothetical protein